ncbi:MAG: hypothetical protein AAFQ68_16485 [Bacteroidota bacterium]
MKVRNVHRRLISQPQTQVASLIATLASKNDQVWPHENWPRMRLKDGLQIGSEGGHGPIRYRVTDYSPPHLIAFTFQQKGFIGAHLLETTSVNETHTEIKHIIEMRTEGLGTLSWLFAVRWLHDALIEDAFDKVENLLTGSHKRTPWSLWVRLLRKTLK